MLLFHICKNPSILIHLWFIHAENHPFIHPNNSFWGEALFILLIYSYHPNYNSGVKVRRLDDEGVSVPVYPTKVSLKAEYDPKVSNSADILLWLPQEYILCKNNRVGMAIKCLFIILAPQKNLSTWLMDVEYRYLSLFSWTLLLGLSDPKYSDPRS